MCSTLHLLSVYFFVFVDSPVMNTDPPLQIHTMEESPTGRPMRSHSKTSLTCSDGVDSRSRSSTRSSSSIKSSRSVEMSLYDCIAIDPLESEMAVNDKSSVGTCLSMISSRSDSEESEPQRSSSTSLHSKCEDYVLEAVCRTRSTSSFMVCDEPELSDQRPTSMCVSESSTSDSDNRRSMKSEQDIVSNHSDSQHSNCLPTSRPNSRVGIWVGSERCGRLMGGETNSRVSSRSSSLSGIAPHSRAASRTSSSEGSVHLGSSRSSLHSDTNGQMDGHRTRYTNSHMQTAV